MGREGRKLKELQDQTATSIHVPRAGETPFVITIQGTSEMVREAAKRIQHISEQESTRDRKKLPIVKAYHQLIAGCDNENVQRLRELTGATVHIPPASKDEDGIMVTGDVAAVARAAEFLMQEYQRLQTTCGEASVKVDRSKHKYVIGQQGKNLKEIFRSTGVAVEVPPVDKSSDEIIIRGPKPNLVHAYRMVVEKAESQTADHVEAPHWLHRRIIGPKGATVNPITQPFPAVHVDFPTQGDRIDIEGPTPEVAIVKQQLQAMIAQMLSEMDHAELRVEPALHSRLIGKNGAQLRALQAETESNIRIPTPNSGSDMIVIEGSPAAVAAAKAKLEAIVAKLKNQAHVDVIIPRRFHSLLIGSGGAAIRELVQQYKDLNVDIPDPKKESDIIVLRGDRADVIAAKDVLTKKAKQLAEENYEEEVPVFKQFHRNIIGKEGKTIRQIKDETNTRIKVPNERSAKDSITITGRQKDVEEAKRRILEIQSQLASIVTEEVLVAPKLHAFLKGKVVNGIQQECGGVFINFPKDTKSDKVTIKGPKDDVEAARAKLTDIARQYELNSTTEEIKVRQDFHRHLIGRGGAALTKLQNDTGARLIFPSTRKATPAAEAETITLLGSPEACAAARAAIEKRVADLENVVEETTPVPRQYHREFLANRSQLLRDLGEEFPSVQISIPKKDDESENFTLKGNKEDVALMIERINEIIDDFKAQITMEFTLPHKHHRSVIGTKGVNLQEITSEHSVNIKFPERGAAAAAAAAAAAPAAAAAAADEDEAADANDASDEPEAAAAAAAAAPSPADTIKISGRKENCEAAWAAIQALVPIQETMEIDPTYHKHIIGKAGAGVKAIMDDSHAFIRFPENSSKVTIRGLRQHVARARELLEERMKDSFTATVECDAKYHRTLIGPKGAAVQAFRKKYNVQLEFPKTPKDAEPNNTITIIGPESDVATAAEAIKAKIAELESLTEHSVDIHPAVHRRVIGQGGCNVREIQDRWSVRINFPRDPDTPTVTIVGLQENCEGAANDLLNLEEEFIDDVLDQQVG